ncbi:MAG: nucleotide exchange factor GrpE [Simkaniaceae bacterium]|nr:nucleotide exchange factor GrpE [Simkaniaceae bacterium]
MSDEEVQGDALKEEFEKSFNGNDEKTVESLPEAEEEAEEGLPLEVIKLQQDLKGEKDKYQRLLAELDNTRKRMQREKEEAMRFAVERTVGNFLAPLDQFEKALAFASQGSQELKQWAIGFEMILAQFKDILAGQKIMSFSAIGEIFDPHYHEAIEIEESPDAEDGKILSEFAKGYRCGDRIIRPAKVKVAQKKQVENLHE